MDVADFVAKGRNCQQVKAEHQRLGGLTQNLYIPTWKWEDIKMGFLLGFPRSRRQHDSIWLVIVDMLTKCTDFLPIKDTFFDGRLCQIIHQRDFEAT